MKTCLKYRPPPCKKWKSHGPWVQDWLHLFSRPGPQNSTISACTDTLPLIGEGLRLLPNQWMHPWTILTSGRIQTGIRLGLSNFLQSQFFWHISSFFSPAFKEVAPLFPLWEATGLLLLDPNQRHRQQHTAGVQSDKRYGGVLASGRNVETTFIWAQGSVTHKYNKYGSERFFCPGMPKHNLLLLSKWSQYLESIVTNPRFSCELDEIRFFPPPDSKKMATVGQRGEETLPPYQGGKGVTEDSTGSWLIITVLHCAPQNSFHFILVYSVWIMTSLT